MEFDTLAGRKSGPGDHADMFRDLCENAHDLIQSVSPDGRFLYVNRAWRQTLGYAAEEIAGLRVFDIIHPDSREHCTRAMQGLLEGQEMVRLEAEFVAKDGRRIAVEGSASCRFESGRPVATRGIFRDVTDPRRAREELDRLFHLSLDLLCVAGTDGYFKQVNPAFEKVLGYSTDELLKRAFIEFVHPDDRPATLAAVERLTQGLPVVDFTNRYQAQNGTYRWLAWRSAPLPAQGLIYAVARDVTEQKRLEALMARQREELARSNADLELFAYAASHDLQAPLRAIANLSEWIGEDLGEALPPEAAKHLGTLRDRVGRLERLVGDLLQFSRVGREAHTVATVNTGELVRQLTELLAPPAGFRVTVLPGMPVIDTARAPLEQVFRNLIENAIKHHDRGSGTVTVSAQESGETVEFRVADDGPGIPEEAREKVFQMFQRLAAREDRGGSGMGLALVRRIVESQGGRIRLEPVQPRGTAFRFTWPRRVSIPEGDDVQHPGG